MIISTQNRNREIFPQIISKTDDFYGFKFQGYWMDIGRISSYIKVHKFLLKQYNKEYFTGKNCTVNGVLKETSLGKNVIIGKNADDYLKNHSKYYLKTEKYICF